MTVSTLVACAALGLAALPVNAQATVAAAERVDDDSLRVLAEWDASRLHSFDVPLSMTLTRELRAADGRLAVIVGTTDVSGEVQLHGRRVTVTHDAARRSAMRTTDVEVFLVDGGGQWRTLGRFTVRRPARGGFDSAAFAPRIDLQTDGQMESGRSTAVVIPARPGAWTDVTGTAGVDGIVTLGGWQLSWQGIANGASRADARLRAAQIGLNAPAVDLASYGLRASRNGIAVSAGHIALGSHRLLAAQFRSRGIAAHVPIGKRVTIDLGTAAGSEIVGWGDPFGLARPSHRIASATLGIDAVPAHPGVFRLEFSALDGQLQSLPAFTQNAVTDREASTGLGVQFSAAHPSQRVRLNVGIARSRFRNPVDPALSGDSTLVEVASETREARFGELQLDVLRNTAIVGLTTSLSLAVRHERTDPQYRSVSASIQADREQDAIDASGQLGALQVQANVSRARDNLGEISSLLITRTRAYTLNAALPVAQLFSAGATAWWLPTLTAAWQHGVQRGDTTPPDGGFRDEFQIPDQRTQALSARAVWQRGPLAATYRYDRSLIDNRQPGRERADIRVSVRAVALSIAGGSGLTAALEVSSESQHSTETDARASNRRASATADWRPWRHTAVAIATSFVRTLDLSSTQRATNLEFRTEVSQGVNAWRRPADGSQARAFLRYARTGAALRLAGLRQPLANQWTLNGGLSVRVF